MQQNRSYKLISCRQLLFLGMSALLLFFSIGCTATNPQNGISKVDYFHLQPEKNYASADLMIPFERKHHLHGAISNQERRNRMGHYYTIFWHGEDHNEPCIVRFEYRQQHTGSKVHIKEVSIEKPLSKNLTRFAIIGEEYHKNGSILAWRASLMRGEEVLSSKKSFLWH